MTDSCVMEKANKTAQQCDVRAYRGYRPAVDIVEQDDAFIVRADVPGATAKDLSIEYEKGVLSLRAAVARREPAGVKPLAREFGVGDFTREFRIGEGIDMAAVTAECANGVLTLRLPKAEAAKPRKIEVK